MMHLVVESRDDDNFREEEHIYLVNYNDPTIFKRISPDTDHPYDAPVFFPDRSKILYRDRAVSIGNTFMVYDLAAESSTYLLYPDGWNANGYSPIVFSPDQQGFYYRRSTGLQSFFYFSITDPGYDPLGDAKHGHPIGLIGTDTLITFGESEKFTGDAIPGLYFMDLGGNYLSRINNPYLDNVFAAIWNDELRLLAFVERGPAGTSPGQRTAHIAVTSLDGVYYKSYTSGPSYDYLLTWGPGGGVLLFMREDDNPGGSGRINRRIMKINLKTGELSLFVEPSSIDGAIGLLWPHYQ